MKRVFVAVSAAALLWCLVPEPAHAFCRLMQDVAKVCVTDAYGTSCSYTIYEYWLCDGGGGGGGGGGGLPDPNRTPEPDEPTATSRDMDNDGTIDDWSGVLETPDPCSQNFDTNDRLGTTYGGPNGIRSGHSGVDIQSDNGDPVFAMKSGTVTGLGLSGNCGWAVVIEHDDGSRATYCHLGSNSNVVTWNDEVLAGQHIASADSTGNVTGPHLHITFRDASNTRREYFWYTDESPSSSQLNPGGC